MRSTEAMVITYSTPTVLIAEGIAASQRPGTS